MTMLRKTYRISGPTMPIRTSSLPRLPGYRSSGIWLCILALALFGGAWREAFGAPPPVEIESVAIGLGARNAYKIGCWTPVRVQLKTNDQRLSGFMELVVPDDDGIPTSYRLPVELGPGQTTRLTAYARPGGRDTEFTIRVLDSQGRRLLEAPQSLTMSEQPNVIMPDETLILTLGQPLGVDQLPSLPGFAVGGKVETGPGASELNITRMEPDSDQIPGRWYGFDAARTIVIDTDDRASLEILGSLRGQSLVEWVKHGGHLVVAVGAKWQAVRDSVIGPILPAQPAGQEQVPSLEALDTFAGSTKPITPAGTPPVLVTRLEGAEERGGKILSIMGNLPLIVRGPYGFGRVTLIGVGVEQKIFGDWTDRGLFWARATDLRHDRPEQAGSGSRLGVPGRFYQSGVSDLSSQLRIALEQFPGVKLIPFGWVAFFIFLYILLIGPGDYLFLKKVLKRMELTWITFPTIVLTVSLLAYFAAYRLKGNDLLVNKVDVIDVDQAVGLVRGWTLLSLFSPQNRDYNIGIIPVPPNLDHDVAPLASPSLSGEPIRPPAGTELLTSWFSVPEAQFGAMGGRNRRFSFAASGYAYEPTGLLERLENVRVPIWSTKAVTARWLGPGPAAPLVDSNLRPVGTDRLAGTISNRQSFPLEDALLAFGKQVYLLGTLAPGATVKVELAGDRNLANLLKDRATAFLSDQPGNRNRKLSRADLLLALMFHGSESTTRGSEHSLSNVALHDLDLTPQLALDRPMLVARIRRPGAQLILENPPSPPRIDQTTMIRIILPLKRPGGDGRFAAAGGSPTTSVAAGASTQR
jgi:hypothetical protein